MNVKKLRMGIIGMGMAFERLHYPAFQKLSAKYEIVAVCDPEIHRAEKWKNRLGLKKGDIYGDYHEIIKRDDIDAFDIMVPIELNYKITEEIAEAGKPVISEKPLAPTIEQAKKAKRLPERYNVPIMIAENYRYNEEINIIRDLIRTQEIGKVHYFIQNRVIDFPQDMLKNKFSAKEWRQHPEYPGGTILDTGVHDISALRHVFGAIEKVQAFGIRQKEDYSPYPVIQANLLFKGGIIGQFSFFSSGKEMQRPLIGLRIFGEKGMIFLEEKDCGTINVAYNDGNTKQIPYKPRQEYLHELKNFHKAATGEEPLSVTPELEFGDTITVLSILKSAKRQEVVTMDEDITYEPVLK